MLSLNKNTIIKRYPDIHSREFDGETVMMDKAMENYFGLDEVGTRVWQLLEKEHTLLELCEQLTKEYDVDIESCINDVKPFIEKLLIDDLITTDN